MIDRIELVTTEGCPFGLTCAGIMFAKGIPFDLKIVPSPQDLGPLGYDPWWESVPLLRQGLFVFHDSIAICEYLSDTFALELHPSDSARRAINRAWIQQAGDFTKAILGLALLNDERAFDEKSERVGDSLRNIEPFLSEDGFFFNGHVESIIDSAYQPFFARHAALEAFLGFDPLALSHRLIAWRDMVNATFGKASVLHTDHGTRFLEYVCAENPSLEQFKRYQDRTTVSVD